MRGMILAAGYGTRLWPLTVDRAKPAMPLLGRPLVAYVAEYLARYGFSDLVINLHHLSQSVRTSLGDGSRFGVHLEYVEEPEILGTSGALDNAKGFLNQDTFVVVNGKIISDIDLSFAMETHRRTNALATLVLKPNTSRERFSVVEVKDEKVTNFGGMPAVVSDKQAESSEPVPLMFTGIQILEPRIFSYIPRAVFSHSTRDVYPQAIAAGETISAHIAEGMWYELSTISRYLEVSHKLLSKLGLDVQIGADCLISKGAEVKDSVLWDNVKIGADARVRESVIADGVEILAGQRIRNAAVVRAELVSGISPPPKALRGTVHGTNFVVPLGQ